jgi:hypothetical protein
MSEPKTHPEPPTLAGNQASDLAWNLWLDIRDVCRTEEALWILESYLDRARDEGYNAGLRPEGF